MKRILFSLATLFLAFSMALADHPQKFSPEKFQADLEQYISKEAELTTEEAEKFFPLYREMQQKQRKVYNQMKEARKNKPADEASFRKAVEKRDCQEIELKQILQNYHSKFFSVLPASKVYRVILAEDKFHRNAFKKWGEHHKPKQKPKDKK
ncbi:MAG: hypothetical protein IJ618_07945 [Prevotella sp.]|nr:hypothetical protein [Prevotella sp.]